MTKRARQGEILRLIDDRHIQTQSELVTALAVKGFEVTQTTVSRDLKDLGLVKVRTENGSLAYSRSGTPDRDQMEALARALQRWVLSVDWSGSLVVIRTPNGYADPVAQAIDESGHPEILGTVAGENTVLVVPVDGVAGVELGGRLAAIAGAPT